MRMTAAQAERARKIAAHAGHFWAVTPETIGLCDTGEIKAASEQAAKRAIFSDDVKGLVHAPTTAGENAMVYDYRNDALITSVIASDGIINIAAFGTDHDEVVIEAKVSFAESGYGILDRYFQHSDAYGRPQIDAVAKVIALFTGNGQALGFQIAMLDRIGSICDVCKSRVRTVALAFVAHEHNGRSCEGSRGCASKEGLLW